MTQDNRNPLELLTEKLFGRKQELPVPKPHRLKGRSVSPPEERLVAELATVGGRFLESTPYGGTNRFNDEGEAAGDDSDSSSTFRAETKTHLIQPGESDRLFDRTFQGDVPRPSKILKRELDVTETVRRQYENLPYPFRNPDDDKRMIRLTVIDNLATLNQYCYGGRRDFDKPFRMLVAGGGTGDSLAFLAVQTAWLPNAEIVYLDLSRESMKIAQERIRNQAKRLSQPNIEKIIDYRIGSLLDLERMGLGKFDYINCCGVLHHLADPSEGLRKLGDALNDDGALGIMVYGQLGRTSVYQVQEMMKLVNRDVVDMEKKIRNTNLVLRCLPSTNLHRKNGRWLSCDPIETYDLYLHEQDRAFTFREIIDWVAAAGLTLSQFTSTMKPLLVPEYLQCKLPRRILDRLEKMSPHEAAEFCEHLVGMINRYEFYVAKNSGTTVDLRDWDLIPSFSCYAIGNSLRNRLQNPPKNFGEAPTFRVKVYQGAIQVPINVSPLALTSYALIDDKRTIRELVHQLASKFPLRTQESLRNELLEVWRHLIAFDMIQFRHVSSRLTNLNRYNF